MRKTLSYTYDHMRNVHACVLLYLCRIVRNINMEIIFPLHAFKGSFSASDLVSGLKVTIRFRLRFG